jgi:hypothetical protein
VGNDQISVFEFWKTLKKQEQIQWEEQTVYALPEEALRHA